MNELLNNLNEATCMMTDKVSITKTPPITIKRSSFFNTKALAANIPPNASDPQSPMYIFAGFRLKYRYPNKDPNKLKKKIASDS